MFKENLKGILQNLPLILSDTNKAKDISVTRTAAIMLFSIANLILIVILMFAPHLLEAYSNYFLTMLSTASALILTNTAKNLIK